MGVLPLTFKDGQDRKSLGLDAGLQPRMDLICRIHRADGRTDEITVLCRADTPDEMDYYRHGGILQYVLWSLLTQGEAAGRA